MYKIIFVLLIFSSLACCDDINTGSDIIIPNSHSGDLLIFNDGGISYSVFVNPTGEYLGTINPNQGIYINKTPNYKIYASYSEISGLSSEGVEKKINQYWYIGAVGIIILLFIIKLYKVVK